MNSLPIITIPVPAARRWRDVRLHWIPMIVFLTTVGTIGYLWNKEVLAPTFVGQVEVVKATVTSPKTGLLVQMNLTCFQRVRAGDTVAQVIITEPRILASSLAVIQAEIGLLHANLQPMLGLQRNAINYDQLKLDWMRERATLAKARVNLQLAETELHRTEELFKDKIVAERLLDQAKANKEKFEAEVDELTKLVAQQQQHLKDLELPGMSLTNAQPSLASTNPLKAAIEVQEARLRLTEDELSPITITASLDGEVSMVYKHSRDALMAGEPIIEIVNSYSDKIVGYLREPLPFPLKAGMPAQISTRSLRREASRGSVVQVGGHMEPITNAVLRRPLVRFTEVGLPIQIKVPQNMSLRPGELVDVTILPSPK